MSFIFVFKVILSPRLFCLDNDVVFPMKYLMWLLTNTSLVKRIRRYDQRKLQGLEQLTLKTKRQILSHGVSSGTETVFAPSPLPTKQFNYWSMIEFDIDLLMKISLSWLITSINRLARFFFLSPKKKPFSLFLSFLFNWTNIWRMDVLFFRVFRSAQHSFRKIELARVRTKWSKRNRSSFPSKEIR